MSVAAHSEKPSSESLEFLLSDPTQESGGSSEGTKETLDRDGDDVPLDDEE